MKTLHPKMNYFTKLISLVSLLGITLTTSVVANPPELPHVLFLGDSITGSGHWISIVAKTASIKGINGGASGRRTSEGKAALEEYLTKYPDATRLVIFLGVNDLPGRDKRPDAVKVSSCVTNISEIIDLGLTRFKPKDIILIAPTTVYPELMSEVNIGKGYNIAGPMLAQLEPAYKALAEKKGVQFLSLLNALTKEQYKDGLHPNEEGDKVIAQIIGTFLISH